MLTNHFTEEEVDQPVYTHIVRLSRYLYSITDVKQSLFLSILGHDGEQALFWGYELYFSGFQEETFDYLLDIAKILFQIYPLDCDEDNHMIDLVNYSLYLWRLSPHDSDHQLGNCILTMCNHNHNLAPFIRTYFKTNIEKTSHLSDNIYITFDSEKVNNYTPSYSDKPLYKELQYARKYAVNKTYNQLFQTYTPENLNEVYFKNWLYHASFSPLWEQRILEYGGIVDEEEKQVIFEDEDLEEEFYSKWNYEPDEQSIETHQKAMGNKEDLQNDLETFCKQYGYKILEDV